MCQQKSYMKRSSTSSDNDIGSCPPSKKVAKVSTTTTTTTTASTNNNNFMIRPVDVVKFVNEKCCDNKSILISQPTEIAYMSRNKDFTWRYNDKSGYDRFIKPKLPVDLNEGFEDFEKLWKHSHPDSLKHVLESIKRNERYQFPKEGKRIVAWRGILRKIMTTPYLNESYVFAVWKYKGVLYFSNREEPGKQESEDNKDRRTKRFMYYGYKFEETATRPKENPNKPRPVDPRECYCRIFKTRIGSNYVIGAGEMDCYAIEENNKKIDLELKVSRVIETNRQKWSFERYKLIKFYTQSFLAGVQKVLVGFRDDDGIVRQIEAFETLKIPKLIKGRENELWDAKKSLAFLNAFLEFLYDEIPECGENVQGDVFLCQCGGDGMIYFRPVPRIDDELFSTNLYL